MEEINDEKMNSGNDLEDLSEERTVLKRLKKIVDTSSSSSSSSDGDIDDSEEHTCFKKNNVKEAPQKTKTSISDIRTNNDIEDEEWELDIEEDENGEDQGSNKQSRKNKKDKHTSQHILGGSGDIFEQLHQLRRSRELELNLKEKRRRELLNKMEERNTKIGGRISVISAARFDLAHLQSRLSGPRLSWDFFNSTHDHNTSNASINNDTMMSGNSNGVRSKADNQTSSSSSDLHIDADRFGGSHSREALKQHIKAALSKANAKSILSSSSSSQVSQRQEGKNNDSLLQRNSYSITGDYTSNKAIAENDKDQSPYREFSMNDVNEAMNESSSHVAAFSFEQVNIEPTIPETQIVGSNDIVTQGCETENEVIEIHQFKKHSAIEDIDEEEEVFADESVANDSISCDDEGEDEEVIVENKSVEEDDIINVAGEEEEAILEGSGTDEEERDEEEESEFNAWLLRRKELKKKKKDLKRFLEEEAEESSDDDMRGITRGWRKTKEDNEKRKSHSDSSSSDEEEGDLEGLLADEEEEARLDRKHGKDVKRLAKLHMQWMEQRDKELQAAVEQKQFKQRSRGVGGRGGASSLLGHAEEGDLSRMQKKKNKKIELMQAMFDSLGNKILSSSDDENGENDVDDDSVDMGSDVLTEYSDNDGEYRECGEDDEMKEIRKQQTEKRKRLREYQEEMSKRRAAIRKKLRESERQARRTEFELKAGLNTLQEEDRKLYTESIEKQNENSHVNGGVDNVGKSMSSSSFGFLGNNKEYNERKLLQSSVLSTSRQLMFD